MTHTVLVILQEYGNGTEIEIYSLRGILELGKFFLHRVLHTLCVKLMFSIHIKTFWERNTVLSKYYPKITLFS